MQSANLYFAYPNNHDEQSAHSPSMTLIGEHIRLANSHATLIGMNIPLALVQFITLIVVVIHSVTRLYPTIK